MGILLLHVVDPLENSPPCNSPLYKMFDEHDLITGRLSSSSRGGGVSSYVTRVLSTFCCSSCFSTSSSIFTSCSSSDSSSLDILLSLGSSIGSPLSRASRSFSSYFFLIALALISARPERQ